MISRNRFNRIAQETVVQDLTNIRNLVANADTADELESALSILRDETQRLQSLVDSYRRSERCNRRLDALYQRLAGYDSSMDSDNG